MQGHISDEIRHISDRIPDFHDVTPKATEALANVKDAIIRNPKKSLLGAFLLGVAIAKLGRHV